MLLQSLHLSNFRNYPKADFIFSPTVTVIVGPNASGKTNLLEAIYLLSTGCSFRAENEKEMIAYGKTAVFVKAKLSGEVNSLEVIVAESKKRLVNGVGRRLVDFIGNMPAVLFWPEDLDLVTDSPSLRRSYLNNVLSLVDREYRRSLALYEKALIIRNKLLRDKKEVVYEKKFNSGSITNIDEQISYWGERLIANGNMITRKREEYLNTINQSSMINGQLLKNIKPSDSEGKYQIFYDKSEISPARLEQYKEEEVLAGNTLVGPHRDDFIISKSKIKDQRSKLKTEKKELSKYGSRGEQRMGVLWLKLAELAFVEEKMGIKPLLLLDDILSELDEEHRKIVLAIIPNQQTVLTTTEISLVKKIKRYKFIKLK